MKSKFRFAVAICLAMTLLLSCLTGCSSETDPAATAGKTAEQTAETPQTGVPETEAPQISGAPETEAPPAQESGSMPIGPERTEQDLRDAELMGRVSAIDGTEVSFEVFRMNEGFSQRPIGEDGQMPGTPGEGGQMPGIPGEGGQMPGTPGEGGQMPGMPGEGGQMSGIPGEGGQMPGTPGEGGQMPGTPGEGGQMPGTPGEGGQMPGTPGEGGQMPGTPGESGQMPGMPGEGGFHGGRGGRHDAVGRMETLTLNLDQKTVEELAVGDLVRLTFDSDGALGAVEKLDASQLGGQGFMDRPGGQGFPDGDFGEGGSFGGQEPGRDGGLNPRGGSAASGTAANTADADVNGETFTSDQADENALKISGSEVTLTDVMVEKTGDGSDTESCDFYGINAGLLAADGAAVTVVGGSFTTNGAGANALFSYGSGTTLTVRDAVIRTSGRNSGGIQTTGGGTTVAENLDVETEGASAAAIRSDRGGGDVRVHGGSYVTHGTGSPAIYSTAEISVSDATLIATASEAVVVEGKNSVTLEDCTVSGSMQGTYGAEGGENLHGIMIYQSMSGDATVGKGRFAMTGGSLATETGDLFYVTNTKAEIYLSGVELTLADGLLLRVSGNDGRRGWGTQGSNGGTVTMTAQDQMLRGDILVDEISSLDLTLSGETVWTGSVNSDGDAGKVRLTLSDGASWTLTADAHVSSFSGDLSAVDTNGFTLWIGGAAAK